MNYSAFLVLLVTAGLILIIGLIIALLARRAARLIGVVLMIIALVVLIPGGIAFANPDSLPTDPKNLDRFPLSILETNIGQLYLVKRPDITEFRYYNPKEKNEYRTIKSKYVNITYLTEQEIKEKFEPSVQIVEATDNPVIKFFNWKIELPSGLSKRAIYFYFKVPKDKVYIE